MSNYTLKDIQKKRKEILLHLYMSEQDPFIIKSFEENKIYSISLYNKLLWTKLTGITKLYLRIKVTLKVKG